jgi:hypothetical protein
MRQVVDHGHQVVRVSASRCWVINRARPTIRCGTCWSREVRQRQKNGDSLRSMAKTLRVPHALLVKRLKAEAPAHV